MKVRTSKAKIAYLIEQLNADNVTVIASLETRKGDEPFVNQYGNRNVAMILDSIEGFKKFGGVEKLTIHTEWNGDNSIIQLELYSSAPSGDLWSRRNMTLLTNDSVLYTLENM